MRHFRTQPVRTGRAHHGLPEEPDEEPRDIPRDISREGRQSQRPHRARIACAGSGSRLPPRSRRPTDLDAEPPEPPEPSEPLEPPESSGPSKTPRRCPFCDRWLGRESTCTVCAPLDSPYRRHVGRHDDNHEESEEKNL